MTNRYDNQTLFSYLLGSLPDTDTELLDEMTFTDPDFAELVNAAEKDLVDFYISGSLTGDTLEKFESHYMASPRRREKVTFARAFREFTANERANQNPPLAAVPESKAASIKEQIGAFFSSLGILGGGSPIFGFAAAAAVLALVLFGGWLLIRDVIQKQGGGDIASTTNINQNIPVNTIVPVITPEPTASTAPVNREVSKPSPTPEPVATPKRQPETPSQPMIATFVLPPPLRGGAPLTQVRLAPQIQAAQFTIALEASDYRSYRVELRDAGQGRSIWQAGSLKARGSSLSVRVPAKLLKSQIYSFSVTGVSAEGTSESIGDYTFRVVR